MSIVTLLLVLASEARPVPRKIDGHPVDAPLPIAVLPPLGGGPLYDRGYIGGSDLPRPILGEPNADGEARVIAWVLSIWTARPWGEKSFWTGPPPSAWSERLGWLQEGPEPGQLVDVSHDTRWYTVLQVVDAEAFRARFAVHDLDALVTEATALADRADTRALRRFCGRLWEADEEVYSPFCAALPPPHAEAIDARVPPALRARARALLEGPPSLEAVSALAWDQVWWDSEPLPEVAAALTTAVTRLCGEDGAGCAWLPPRTDRPATEISTREDLYLLQKAGSAPAYVPPDADADADADADRPLPERLRAAGFQSEEGLALAPELDAAIAEARAEGRIATAAGLALLALDLVGAREALVDPVGPGTDPLVVRARTLLAEAGGRFLPPPGKGVGPLYLSRTVRAPWWQVGGMIGADARWDDPDAVPLTMEVGDLTFIGELEERWERRSGTRTVERSETTDSIEHAAWRARNADLRRRIAELDAQITSLGAVADRPLASSARPESSVVAAHEHTDQGTTTITYERQGGGPASTSERRDQHQARARVALLQASRDALVEMLAQHAAAEPDAGWHTESRGTAEREYATGYQVWYGTAAQDIVLTGPAGRVVGTRRYPFGGPGWDWHGSEAVSEAGLRARILSKIGRELGNSGEGDALLTQIGARIDALAEAVFPTRGWTEIEQREELAWARVLFSRDASRTTPWTSLFVAKEGQGKGYDLHTDGEVLDLAVAHRARRVAIRTASGVELLDPVAGTRVAYPGARGLALSPDGRWLAVLAPEHVEILRFDTGEVRVRLDGQARAAAWDPTGAWLGFVTASGRTALWAPASGELRELDTALYADGLSLSAGARRIALRQGDRAHVFEPNTGRVVLDVALLDSQRSTVSRKEDDSLDPFREPILWLSSDGGQLFVADLARFDGKQTRTARIDLDTGLVEQMPCPRVVRLTPASMPLPLPDAPVAAGDLYHWRGRAVAAGGVGRAHVTGPGGVWVSPGR
ncbi:MAG: hypothetical protein H6736_03720 [Alphaproteobacteria bacterium]|nr:hypothetical protein [Alphaproteobacteria bacterium]